ncbi:MULTISPECIES: recombinase family protein [Hafniaceae]|jgi:DNA invertase Pin-like site-specific DNA recombinase|uniref:recombinase family protein n=1 Tax=Hafniaceae TaxID=1903412 RepID=UPI000622679B|nr:MULTISPECIES: recombinase family protein [Hafniaceae]KKI47721.1 integrase [Obesumbacterium proteus]QBJ31778.1 recombinase family protein [Hafnia alvei]
MAKVGYARVSTTGQSLDTQITTLAGCEKIFKEKISGAKDDRPELLAMLEFVREGDTVQVTKLDRLARNTRHLLEVSEFLQSKGVALNILNIGINTATPTGKLMLTMIGAIATFEREMMLERQAEGIALAKLKGKYKGRKATARSKSQEVIEMLDKGLSKPEISRQLGIGITSIYRIVRTQSED